jgi:hypothetical protein
MKFSWASRTEPELSDFVGMRPVAFVQPRLQADLLDGLLAAKSRLDPLEEVLGVFLGCGLLRGGLWQTMREWRRV